MIGLHTRIPRPITLFPKSPLSGSLSSNHRRFAGILDYIRRLGALVGESVRADAWAAELAAGLDAIAAQAASLPQRPRVYFEEWDEPRISGIRWVSELVGIDGGDDIFPERAKTPLAKHRIVAGAREISPTAPRIRFWSRG